MTFGLFPFATVPLANPTGAEVEALFDPALFDPVLFDTAAPTPPVSLLFDPVLFDPVLFDTSASPDVIDEDHLGSTMSLLKQSTAANVTVKILDSSDHRTGKTGLTLTITASKNGAAFASISPTVTEISSGLYKLALTTAHTDTLGDLVLHITGSGADTKDVGYQVVPELPGQLASGAIVSGSYGSQLTPVMASGVLASSSGADVTLDAGASTTGDYAGCTLVIIPASGPTQVRGIVSYTGATKVTVPHRSVTATAGDVWIVLRQVTGFDVALALDTQSAANIDTWFKAASAAVTNNVNDLTAVKTNAAAIKAKTDTIPTSPASQSDVTGLLTTALTEAYPALGGNPTLTQALFAILQILEEASISGNTMTVKKRDRTTAAMTYTLAPTGAAPVSKTRAT
jgi:hypothetical protein